MPVDSGNNEMVRRDYLRVDVSVAQEVLGEFLSDFIRSANPNDYELALENLVKAQYAEKKHSTTRLIR